MYALYIPHVYIILLCSLNENFTVYGDIQLKSMRYSDQSILANELGLLIYVIVTLACIYITLRFVTTTICR